MKTPQPPFHNTNDDLLFSILTGGNCLGYVELSINDSDLASLTPPLGSVYALLVLEADPGTEGKSKIARFIEAQNSVSPTSTIGIPLGDLSVYEVKGKQNLENFKIIGIEGGKVHSLKIQYYG